MDGMGLGEESVVVLHVGGAAGGVDAGIERFEQGFELLSDAARARLVVENDDRSYGLGDVLRLAAAIARPVVWDTLHHHCHDPHGIPDREALGLALDTWPDGVAPKIHYSTPKTALEERTRRVGRRVERTIVLPQLRAHADLIDPIGFEWFLRRSPRATTSTSCSRPRRRTSRCCGCASSCGPAARGPDARRPRQTWSSAPKPQFGVCRLRYRAGSDPGNEKACRTPGGTCTHVPACARIPRSPSVSPTSPSSTYSDSTWRSCTCGGGDAAPGSAPRLRDADLLDVREHHVAVALARRRR